MNESHFYTAVKQSKNLENSIRIFVSESYHYCIRDSFRKSFRLASTLLSNVIPLKFLVKEYYSNQDQDKQSEDIFNEIFLHLNMIEEILKEVSELGVFLEEELEHVYGQFQDTKDVFNGLLDVFEEATLTKKMILSS